MGFLGNIVSGFFKILGVDLEPQPQKQVQGVDFTAPATDAAIPVFYGEVKRTGGTIIYRATNDVVRNDVENELLHLIIVWGEANGATVKQIYIDDEPITSDKFHDEGAHWWAYTRNIEGGRYSDPLLNASGWSPDRNLPEGLLYSYVRLEMGADDPVFTSRPNITADIEQTRIHDVRTGTKSNVTSNPALQLYDYLTNTRYGKGLPSSDLDVESFKRAANICDLQVESYEGGATIPLYTSNVRLNTSKSVKANCEMLLASMRASLPVVNGKLTLVLEENKAPISWEANEQTIVSDIEVNDASKKDRYNQVTVQYYDEKRNGKLQDAVFPEPSSAIDTQWLAQDNDIRLTKKVKIETLNSFYEAKRIAEFIARKSREQLSIKFTARDDAALLAIGDVIRVSDELLGFDKKPFVLNDMVLNGSGEVDLSLVEHQPSHFSWEPSAPQTIIEDTVYRSRKPDAPAGLQASVGEDNTLKVEWQSASNDFEYQVRRNGKVVKSGNTTLHDISLALDAGEYQISIYAVNILGYRSSAATLLFTVAEPAVPTVEITSLTPTSVVLYATTTGASTQTNYEWQFAGEGEQKTVISQVLTVSSLLPSKSYQGRVRTLNAAGKSQWKSFDVKTADLATYEHSTALVFEMSQSPNWIGMGVGWQPEGIVNQVRVSLRDLQTQQELAFQTLQVELSDDGVLYGALGEEKGNVTDSELAIEFLAQATSNLIVEARHELQVVRQAFSVSGLSVNELKETQEKIREIDDLANSILEQALDTEQVFEADLTSTLTLEEKTAKTNARINEAVAVQADENQALATRVSEVKALVGENNAQIVNVEQSLADKERAIATNIRQVEAQVVQNKAQIVSVEQASATQNQALANKISEVKAVVDGNSAQIVNVEQSLATKEQALATKISGLTSEVAQNKADVQHYYITKADAQSAVSQAKTELESKVNSNRAYLDQTFYTAAQTNSVISAKESSLRSEFNGDISSLASNTYTKVETEKAIGLKAQSLSTEFGGKISKLGDIYFSKTDSNGALASFVKNVSVETDSGTASVFQLMTTHARKLDEQGNQIDELDARVSIGVDVNNHVTGLTITPGRMQVKAGVFELLDNSNNSAVYFDSSAGKYKFNGHINASSGSFTGHVNATSGSFTGNVYANSGIFKGRVEADSGTFKGKVEATSGTFRGKVEASSGVISNATLRSCTWDSGGSSTVTASSGMLAIKQDGVLNARFMANGEGFLRNLYVWDNGKPEDVWGIAIKYHSNAIHVDASSWALYAKNGEIGPHTSAHETLLPKELEPEPGDILCDDELMHIANISNAICTAKLSSTPMDITVRGIYTRRRVLTDSQPAGLVGFEEWEQLAYLYDIASINAGGEGAMNVCGEGGNLQTGDLICSSSMPGKGMRQPTQSEERYTIAQVRHNVTFDSPDQIKQVAVIYKRG
ncbi:hypothetical protein HG263_03000 [Pseudoalteromonas sp. JBTF-M23]|uniref:Fibronectin type-III domain-containing protein n=1 Tax=Pseudoalteromonas caenipelagi TaxID=2726988 RepID=A0A849V8H3_9GAMM|nr:phage tail protein [Pseudoalteromonas caenipelagi]NOU49516.1 hypothetical protein [Pseudoalteromonas caenipelagi]